MAAMIPDRLTVNTAKMWEKAGRDSMPSYIRQRGRRRGRATPAEIVPTDINDMVWVTMARFVACARRLAPPNRR